jgi:hypothetical protein
MSGKYLSRVALVPQRIERYGTSNADANSVPECRQLQCIPSNRVGLDPPVQ